MNNIIKILSLITLISFNSKAQKLDLEWNGTSEDLIRLIEGGKIRFVIEAESAGVPDKITFKIKTEPTDTLMDIMTFLEDGSVGIGTTDPTSKLEVNGGIISNSIKLIDGAQENKVLTSDANGAATWGVPVASGTYTPTFSVVNGFNVVFDGPNYTTGTNGRYSRIGNLVIVQINLGTLNFSAGTNTARISLPPGLPAGSPFPVTGVFGSDQYRNGTNGALGLVSHYINTEAQLTHHNASSGHATGYCTFTYYTSAQ